MLFIETIGETLDLRSGAELFPDALDQEVRGQPVAVADEARIGLYQWKLIVINCDDPYLYF
ncbi:hypothetical protein RB24_22740 [Herbaspirillum rubrisubalbicans]|uniref:Uncharacterized protein n=1 Tax=Herbaspirillum rubrisubalbicans TaxID=80842 RepID=A0ABX9BVY0_9BURK|nr:hypothetical protein RB24_22740 [Herbaspirillum rubrisubalbicans]